VVGAGNALAARPAGSDVDVHSDWKPSSGFETLFQSAMSEDFVYVPGAGGHGWLVRATRTISMVDYRTLIPGAPRPTDLCYETFPLFGPDSGGVVYGPRNFYNGFRGHLMKSFTNTETRTCERAPDGTVTCVDAQRVRVVHQRPAVDRDGVLYGLSEDGNLYVIDNQGHQREKVFLSKTIASAYTPVSLDPRGRVHAQDNGELYVLGRG
jgi:hypothetical protein